MEIILTTQQIAVLRAALMVFMQIFQPNSVKTVKLDVKPVLAQHLTNAPNVQLILRTQVIYSLSIPEKIYALKIVQMDIMNNQMDTYASLVCLLA